ncbi:MAG: permease [Candidatus Hydrogenedens sp.]|nr:permease [Candidatus Hydrogenedens sp.]
MSYEYDNNPAELYGAAAEAPEVRAAFISKTYMHLLAAVIAFLGIETVLLQMPFTPGLIELMLTGAGGYSWLLVLGLFMAVSFVANRWAESSTSLTTQYAGLGLYVVAQSFLFLPLLFIAQVYGGPNVIPTAGFTTFGAFLALTAVVFITRQNFSFIGPFLGVAGIGAMAFIVCSILFGFDLGNLFTIVMIVFACGYILYDTSRVLHEYHSTQYVAASLALFASVTLLLWYVLRLFMSRD